ncbi:dephospho-CoA kinase [Maribacter sp. 2307ULW6-5]|uniref:dephospho-CoA kinase n=1 Tax=Maribacter sp. 2307ULW6-5 TaxID=3386275 RepID=UPI0039BC58A9
MIVGLTGGIGSGKSTVANVFRELGVPVYDSDAEAKLLMQGNAAVRAAIMDLLGKDSYTDQGLNRAHIAKRVFADKELLQALNAIVHPAVKKHFLQWQKEQRYPYVVQETALIFENGAADRYDKIILVTAPEEVRIQRVMQRDGASREAVLARMEHQWKDGVKIPLSDFVIHNLEVGKTRERVKEINAALLPFH